MKNNSRFSPMNVLEMKDFVNRGYTRKEIAKLFKCSPNMVTYLVNDSYRAKRKVAMSRYRQKHVLTAAQKERSKVYLQSPAGKRSVAKSWVRHYLRDGTVSKEDILGVLEEFQD